jgi:hypothetical protein
MPPSPNHADAGEKEQCSPNQHDQHRLSKIGLQHQARDRERQEEERDRVGWHFRAPRRFCKQPGDQDHERGFEKFGRLNIQSKQHDPAPRSLDLGAELDRCRNKADAEQENTKSEAPYVPFRQQRGERKHA